MGNVHLRSTISRDGVVEQLEVLESPDGLLTAAAVEAVEKWAFEPALCDGTPVGVYYELTIKFSLK
jgi:TonB family protein